MANKKHLAKLKQGVETWNAWRLRNPRVRPDFSRADLDRANLSGADFSGANLSEADLSGANLRGAHLDRADLWRANLSAADLSGARLNEAYLMLANLSKADLRGADLSEAKLTETDLSGTDLRRANLDGADLSAAKLTEADLSEARLYETLFVNVDLCETVGLDRVDHRGPSTIDHRTLGRSGQLPLAFLRGVGLPDRMIEYLPSLFGEAIQFYSCFISYTSADHDFAKRLHADLQDAGVRCWFAPEDLKIGDPVRDTIDQAIRVMDKLVLILSETSIDSDWVEHEVNRALAEEERRGQLVLFPIRLDDAVMETEFGWAKKIREAHKPTGRHIGDFSHWKDHDQFQAGFERLLRDLKANNGDGGG